MRMRKRKAEPLIEGGRKAIHILTEGLVELGLDLEKGLGIDEGSVVESADSRVADGRVAGAAETKASTHGHNGH